MIGPRNGVSSYKVSTTNEGGSNLFVDSPSLWNSVACISTHTWGGRKPRQVRLRKIRGSVTVLSETGSNSSGSTRFPAFLSPARHERGQKGRDLWAEDQEQRR